MNLTTLGKYLLGNGEAILRIAASRNAVWLGLLFVISAGFAREYDGEYLLAEPWHLALPFVASLGTSFLLFSLLWLLARGRSRAGVSFFAGYRSFLGLYWLTAPLAWLYAIPVERFLDPVAAAEANLWLLGIVSAWRVFLMIRVAIALFGASVFGAVASVLLFADVVALVLIYFTPMPVVSFMGGVHGGADAIVRNTSLIVGAAGVLTLPVWMVGTVWNVIAGEWTPWFPATTDEVPRSRGLWKLAAASLLIWLPILPYTQNEQRLRFEAEHRLQKGPSINDVLGIRPPR
jgi:hypothetical protein